MNICLPAMAKGRTLNRLTVLYIKSVAYNRTKSRKKDLEKSSRNGVLLAPLVLIQSFTLGE